MKTHYITKENLREAINATRVILNMYNDTITSCGGFSNNPNADTFDAFRYIRCSVAPLPGSSVRIDLDLLHEGSAVALLCHLSNFWDQHGGNNIGKDVLTGKIWRYLNDGAFERVPIAKDAGLSAFEDGDIFRAKLHIVYESYILGYFHKAVNTDDEMKRSLRQ